MTPIKIALNTIGVLAVVLGVIGIFLPLVPTTPFLLLASACFMRGSERLHRQLLANRLFGKAIRDFEEKRAIPLRAKILGMTTMWMSLLFSMYLVQVPWLQITLAAIGVAVSIYLLRLRTLAPGE